MSVLWLCIWSWSRKRALNALRRKFPTEYAYRDKSAGDDVFLHDAYARLVRNV